jgi:hypothetical protein
MQKTTMLAVLLTCGAAQAADWQSYDISPNGYRSFMDVSSIQADGTIRKFWSKGVPRPNTVRGPGEYATKWLSYFLTREAINCEEQTFREESKVAYLDDGTTFSAPTESYPTPWKPIPPDSRAEAEMKIVCAWNPK